MRKIKSTTYDSEVKHWLQYNGNSRKNEIYGNCRVYSPGGNLMFLCVDKKIDWYLSRVDEKTKEPLAFEIKHNNPFLNFLMNVFGITPRSRKIKFNFEPKEEGNKGDRYSLSKKKNKCVVTGSKVLESLTTHHITPYCYRKYFPEEYKSANSHDVVPIRSNEHYDYERVADELKLKLAKKYKAPLEGSSTINHTLFYAIKSAHAIKSHGDKIPKDNLEMHKEKIRAYTGKKNVTQKIIENLIQIRYDEAKKMKPHGEIVVEKLMLEGPDAMQKFVEMWRQHFIDTMKPKYMPKHWDIKRPASRLDIKN
jgi:hypothetical protein